MLLNDVEQEIARFRRVVVHDPARRLPALELPFGELAGALVVPDRGVPIHADSFRRFVATMRRDEPLAWTPEVPVSTALGLPRYDGPLLEWIPAQRPTLQDALPRLRRALGRLRSGQAGSSGTQLPADARRIVETTVDERVHYFATHFGAISRKPIQVSVVVTNACNLECVMCPYHSPTIRPTHTTDYFDDKQTMRWEHMEQIAAECGRLQIPVKMGNIEEPLLHPRLTDFVRLCRQRGAPSVHITTNGTILTERMARGLLEAGLTSIYISIDAARPDTYKRVRGSDLVKLEANIRGLLRLIRETGASCRVMTSFVRNHGVTTEEEREFRDRWTAETDGAIFYNLGEYHDNATVAEFATINRVAKDLVAKEGRWACLNPFQEMYVVPDGRIYYCCETVSQLGFTDVEPMGHHPVRGLDDIWLGDTFTRLRRDLLKDELDAWPSCKTCTIWPAHVSETQDLGALKVTRNMITEIFEAKR